LLLRHPRHVSHTRHVAPQLLLFFTHPPAPRTHTLSLHDALPISRHARASGQGAPSNTRLKLAGALVGRIAFPRRRTFLSAAPPRSEEHTSELQSRRDLVCRLLLEKKKIYFARVGLVLYYYGICVG